MSPLPTFPVRDDTPIATDYTDITELFAVMRKAAKEHPDWTFMAADDPGLHHDPVRVPRLGWTAFAPGGQEDDLQDEWTIKLSDIKNSDEFKLDDVGMRDALQSAAGRTKLIELIIGRSGDPAGTPVTKAIAATKAAIIAWQEVEANPEYERKHSWCRHELPKNTAITIKVLKALIGDE